MSWKTGFPEQEGDEAYRSRARAKRRKEQEDRSEVHALSKRQHALEALVRQLQQQLPQQQGATPELQLEPAVQGSQRKSSVASTAAVATDDEAPMDRYPVENITEKTNCELHLKKKNISMKVATGFALPCGPAVLWHGNEIPAGYARVGVDEIQRG